MATVRPPVERPLVPVDDALARILDRFAPLDAEQRNLEDALGQVLAEDATAPQDVPPFANSAMDGYAVRAEDVAGATGERPARLPVIDEIPAGTAPRQALEPRTAIRIMTGAPIPHGADTVVPFEETDRGDREVAIRKAIGRGLNTRAAGEDVRAGEVVVAGGTLLRPAEIGVLAASGHARVRVVRRPRVAVLSTGEEVVEITEAPAPGKIRDTNRYSLAAAVRAAGAVAVPLGIARDTADDLRGALRRAAREDVVVTSGGVSVGDHDFVKVVVRELGSMDFWSIAIRPGRPLAFGDVLGKPIFGLPGNPVSALLTFELFVRPALLRLQGRAKLHRPRATARLLDPVTKPPHLRMFARGVHDPAAGTVRTTGPQGSGILRSMALANCLVDVPEGPSRLEAGSEVIVVLTDQPEDH